MEREKTSTRGGEEEEEEEEDLVCLDGSFFVNRDYEVTSFTFGSHVIELLCLHSASTDYDLTGQLVWPGAVLLNNHLCKNEDMLNGCSVIELGSGVGITGILCSKFCREVVLTDHNDEVLEILKKNIELQASSGSPSTAALKAKKLEWGDAEHMTRILEEFPAGFDIVLGADIYILLFSLSLHWVFQQSNIPPLFSTVKKLLGLRGPQCRIHPLIHISIKIMDEMVISEATKQGMKVKEVPETRAVISNLEGVIFEISLA
ncbi:unnamed protein product [Spirodela intermedia]|uniref:Uncharacterized protein n=1 Tax=Spirodela intermedia TaxID=51605 RepID=A0A7I8JHD4_SPIIN|nr:unnamed protein product [Spirodela intermedia]CAA6669165.1 unnamed protein product [Spirodela intermedia]